MKMSTPHPMRNPNPTAKATGLAYLMFERPSLGDAARYLTDFGLRFVLRRKNLLFFRGTDTAPFCYVVRRGPAPRFVGLGLQVESDAELKALARVPGASAIQPCSWPGGGWWVHLRDPSGFKVDVIQRQHAVGELEHRAMLSVNAPSASHRVNEEQRPPLSAPEVNKLGYVMLDAVDFQSTCAWYTQHFGFIPSDVQVLPDGSPALAFMRLDLGDTPTDHHTLALAQGIAPAYNHSAYEVVDTDAIGVGQRVLREHGWKHAWGIGRHTLGSQIFDYWKDPWGDSHGHYCDGDLFTAHVPMGVHEVSREAMSQWGPVMPAGLIRPKLGLSALAAAVRGLRNSPDLNLAKLHALAKALG